MKSQFKNICYFIAMVSIATISSIYPVVEASAEVNPPKWEGDWVMCNGQVRYECDAVGNDCIDQWCCGD